MQRVLSSFLLISLLFPLHCFSQEVVVKGSFSYDSVKLGEEVPYHITARYPSHLSILFPDSTFDYAPFQYVRKKYFTTKTTNGSSYDSVVYFLSTFEIDKIQFLELPVFVTHQADCTAVFSVPDSISLSEIIPGFPDSLRADNLPLRINVAYEPVPQSFNYPIVIAIVYIFTIVIAITWLVFHKRIKAYFKLRKIRKAHARFLMDYEVNLENLKKDYSPSTAEATLYVWKKYLEQLHYMPFTKLTTQETLRILRDSKLKDNLRSIDRTIYGNDIARLEPFEYLKTVAVENFNQKLEEVKRWKT